MKALKIILSILLGLAAIVVVLGLFAKKDYHIERSTTIDAPRDVVYEYVRYFKNFEGWSPWAHLDPNMKTSITGTDGNVGAVYQWTGNDKVGVGQQTITAMTPERIDMELKFLEPWESTAPAYMTFSEDGKSTKVTWAFDMHIGFPWNGLSMFTDVDAGVGKDYVLGLKNLKAKCEEIAHKKYNGYEVAVQELPVKYYVGIRKTIDTSKVAEFYAKNLPLAFSAIQKGGLEPAGAPSGLYWTWGDEKGQTDMAATVPVAEEKKLGSGLGVFPIGGHQALVIEHLGAYEKVGAAHMAMDAYMQEKQLQLIPPVIEEYVTDPSQEPDTAKWLTRVIYFVEPAAAGEEGK